MAEEAPQIRSDVGGRVRQQPSQAYDTLNPNVAPVQTPDSLRYGHPVNASNSFGDLFKAVGNLGDEVVQGFDNFFKARIDREAHEEIDPIRSMATANLMGQQGGDAPPPQIGVAARGLQNMRQAADQGNITNVYYEMQLDAVARGLRSRYPGYRDYIDQQIHSITGSTPANKIIQDLFAKQGKSDPEQALMYHNVKELQDVDATGWVNQVRKETGAYPSNVEMGLRLAKIKGGNYAISAQENQLKLNEAQGKGSEAEAERVTRDGLFKELTNQTQAGGGMWSDTDKLKKNITEAIGSLQTDGAVLSEKQLQAIQQGAMALQQKYGAITSKYFAQAGGNLTDQAKERIKKDVDMQLSLLTAGSGINGQTNLGLLHFSATQLALQQNADHLDLVTHYPAMRAVEAARKVIGDQTLGPMLLQGSRGAAIMSDASDQVFAFSQAKRALGQQTLPDGIREVPGSAKPLIQGAIKGVLDKNAKPEGVQNILNMMYGGENILTARNKDGKPLVLPEQHHQLYTEMTSPNIVAKIQSDLKEGKVKPEQWNNYRQWAETSGMFLFRKDIVDAKALAISNETHKIEYNPNTHQFSVIEKPGASRAMSPTVDPMRNLTASTRAMTDFNNTLAPLINILKVEGEKADVINAKVDVLFKKQGVDLGFMKTEEKK